LSVYRGWWYAEDYPWDNEQMVDPEKRNGDG